MHRHALATMLAVGPIACGGSTIEPTPYGATSRPVASSSGAEGNKINEWLTLSAIAFSYCHDELIDVAGKAHLVETFSSDGSISLHINTAGISGTGESTGLTYNLIETGREELAAGSAYDVIATIHYRAVTRGSEQNDLLDLTVHVFVDEEGEVHQEIVKLRSECVG